MAFEKVASNYAVPDSVWQSVESVDTSKLSSDMFADPVNREFPMFSKEATLLSLADYATKESEMDTLTKSAVSENLLKAVEYYGIKEPLAKKASGPEKLTTKVSDPEYTMTIQYSATPEGVNKAASRLVYTLRTEYPYAICKTAALDIVKQANEHSISVDKDIEGPLFKLAGLAVASKESVCDALRKRAYSDNGEAYEESSVYKQLYKKASAMPDGEVTDTQFIHKVATVLDEHDNITGRKHWYRRGATAPEDELYDMTIQKAASILEDTLTIPSVGVQLSKRSMLEDHDGIVKFLSSYGCAPVTTEENEFFRKIASLNRAVATAFLNAFAG